MNIHTGHSVNVCILALMIGIHLGYSRSKLFHLAMGALLHDIGKTSIPERILNKPGKLSNAEFEIIKQHSIYGYKILNNNPNISHASALIAQQHHERYNGQGYPNALSKDDIHEFAKITGIADMYDAITADRVYRKAHSPHEAFEIISASGDNLFDFYLVEAFLHHLTAYPTGTLVKLNTGEIAIVTENYPGYSRQPKVRMLFSSSGCPLTVNEELWLAEDCKISISKVITDTAELNILENKVQSIKTKYFI